MPVTLQTLAMRTRQRPFLERARRRYGPLFTVRVHGLGPTVGVADPQLIKQTFKADPTVLHAGTASPLRELLGDNSLLGIDEAQHMEQRKLLLPPFKGQRMKQYEPIIAEIAAEDIERWPQQTEFAVARAMQRITLRAILRAVFGAGVRACTRSSSCSRAGATSARGWRSRPSCAWISDRGRRGRASRSCGRGSTPSSTSSSSSPRPTHGSNRASMCSR